MALTRARIARSHRAAARAKTARARKPPAASAVGGRPRNGGAREGSSRRTTSSSSSPRRPGNGAPGAEKDDDDGGTEDTDATRRALVGVLAAVALATAPVADATEGVSRSISSTSSSSSSAVAAPWTRQLFDLAGFGAPTGALSSRPRHLPTDCGRSSTSTNAPRRRRRSRRFVKTRASTSSSRSSAALALTGRKGHHGVRGRRGGARRGGELSDNIRDVENAYVGSRSDPEVSRSNPSQRVRLLDRRLTSGSRKTLRRRVEELGLEAQGADAVYGSALAASVLSTAAMHPVDTIKVRRQTAKGKGKRRRRQTLEGGRGVDPAPVASPPSVVKVERVRR